MDSASHIGDRGPFKKTNRSAFENFLRAKYEMYTGAVRVASYPYFLTLEASDVCQLRCPTCVTGIENEVRRKKSGALFVLRSNRTKLSTDLYDRLLSEMGDYLFLLLFYNFGEPLLNSQLPRLVARAHALGIETDINTNLSLRLSDQYIEDLLASGVDYIQASIDGFTQGSYETHRVGGNIELVKENLGRLVEARDRMGLDTSIGYNMLVFSFNEHEVDDARVFAEELGIKFNTRDAFTHNPDWLPSYRKNEPSKPAPDLITMPPEMNGVLVTGETTYREGETNQQWSPLPPADPAQPPRCSWHYGYSAISAGGSVAPCCGLPTEQHDFGKVDSRATFADVWNNELYQKSRADFAGRQAEVPDRSPTVCGKCPLSPFMYHLYSLHDFKVIAQFDRAIGEAAPELDHAFDLLCQARYGIPKSNIVPEGTRWAPTQMLEHQDAERTRAFVDFYEKSVLPA